jgi:Do/DeqQ family serine protease
MMLRVISLLAALISFVLPATAQQVPQSSSEIRLSFAPIVRTTAPAVVNVYARSKVEVSVSPFANDPFFRQFFGDNLPGQKQERLASSLGSGVIVDKRGYIVTNNHVVANATDVRVALADRREYDAKVLLTDPRSDLAVLKIEAPSDGLPALQFGDSDQLAVGDLALAIGNPFGIGQTVTSGIISALARSDTGIGDAQFFIQTDAAINPGNSGGALVDMQGRLIGINTAIISKSGGSVGIGFAIPANMVRLVVLAAENGGRFVRPWMGAAIQEVTNDIADSLGLDRPDGGLVLELDPTSPLALAGLKRGDVIVAVNGQHIQASRELLYRIVSKPVGSTVQVTYIRNGKNITAPVKLIPAPENPRRDQRTISANSPLGGVVVANLSPAVMDEMNMPLPEKGVVVTDPGKASGARFLKKGDVIAGVNGTSITSVAVLAKALEKAANRLELTIVRGGKPVRIRLAG